MDVMLPDLGGFTAVLDIDNDSSDVQVKVGINEDLAKRSFLIVLYVRLCVFDAFLDSVSGLGMDLARMKKLWLMLQISSSTLGFGSDIFLDFAKSLRPSPPEPLRTAIDLLRSRIYEQHKIPGIFLIVDEAQAAVGSTSKAFLDKKSEVHRPALRALAQFWSKYTEAGNCRLSMVFSGTGLSFDDMNETLSSGIGKPVLCTHTGSFSKLDDIRKYVRSYIPDVDEHFIRRIMWWLRGRCEHPWSPLYLFLTIKLLGIGLLLASSSFCFYTRIRIEMHFLIHTSTTIPERCQVTKRLGPTWI
jgi:hypothetical protein